MKAKLEKSSVNNYSKEFPVLDDIVLYQVFDDARKDGFVGEIVNLHTGECSTTIELMQKADEFAKGLLAIGMKPGEDNLSVIACPTMNSVALFVACSSIGIGFAHPFIPPPKERHLVPLLSLINAKTIVVGGGADGATLNNLISIFEGSTAEKLSCAELPSAERIFYDASFKATQLQVEFIDKLQMLVERGKQTSDEQLEEAKQSVKPHHTLHHCFTSGSTGKSKCVAHSHRGLTNELLLLREKNLAPVITINNNIDEMISYACIAWTFAGRFKKVVLTPDFIDGFPDLGEYLTNSIIEHEVEYILLSGDVEQAIASHTKRNSISIPSLKLFTNGAQIISRGFKEKLQRIFSCMAFTSYGMSETFMLAFTSLGTNPEDEESRLEAKLFPKPNCELRVVNEDNKVVDVGQYGEIQVKTYSFLKEYKAEEEKTRELYTADGFLRTGDVGVMFDDGYFQVKGRCSDAMRFKVFGDVLYPAPIEEVLGKHPAIKECSVISGRNNDWMGDEITYCIRLEDNSKEIAEEELNGYCENNGLGELQLPSRIIYFERLPTTANARKVSRSKLKEVVGAMLVKDETVGLTEKMREIMTITGADTIGEL